MILPYTCDEHHIMLSKSNGARDRSELLTFFRCTDSLWMGRNWHFPQRVCFFQKALVLLDLTDLVSKLADEASTFKFI